MTTLTEADVEFAALDWRHRAPRLAIGVHQDGAAGGGAAASRVVELVGRAEHSKEVMK